MRTAHDGDEATATKRFAEAARHGELAIQIRADNRATDHILLGQAYAGLGKLAAADAQFRQAIACDPACLDAYSSPDDAVYRARQVRRRHLLVPTTCEHRSPQRGWVLPTGQALHEPSERAQCG